MISKLFHSCHVSPRWAEGHMAGHRRCKRRQDLDGYQYIELTWNDVVEYIYIYTYRYVSKYTSVDLCFLYIIHLREKKSLLPIMPIYIYILLILPFYVSQTWLSPQAQKAMTKVIRHLTTCVVATLQDRYQTSTASVRWKKQNLQAADDLAVHQLHWGFKQQRLAMAISCCVAQM